MFDVKTVFARIGVVALLLAASAPGFAGQRTIDVNGNGVLPRLEVQLAQSDEEGGYGEQDSSTGDLMIRPREAARIARSAVPGSRVLKVRLLPSGIYAVTLRGNGELTRVMVDGQTGNIL